MALKLPFKAGVVVEGDFKVKGAGMHWSPQKNLIQGEAVGALP